MTNLDRATARRLISHLKAGTTPIDCVEHINVGNDRWYRAATEQFGEIQADNDALVRFINGYYGDGKTHFLGMLRSIAFNKGWFATYVTAEATPLHKFDIVYSEVVKNLCSPPTIVLPSWVAPPEAKGARALLGGVFAKMYHDSYRLLDRGGLQKERVLEALRKRAADLAADPHLHEVVGLALRAYVEATIRGDSAKAHAVIAWLEGTDIRIDDAGLSRRIDQKFARDAMRSISVLARYSGAGGVLILLDEAERIMEQTRSIRNKSYGVIRDLLDNADGQGGMRSSIMYVAGTPELFKSEKGFPEYDALRSRLASVINLPTSDLVDWRGVIVDLTKTPLPHDILIRLARRVIDLHALARDWDPKPFFGEDVISKVVSQVEAEAFSVTKPRLLASLVATVLDVIEQNRNYVANEVLENTLKAVQVSLSKQLDTKLWE